jgi:hypothetical protein
MKRVAGALAAVPVALAGVSWHTLAGMTLAVLIFTAALSWTITDSGRSRRLAMLIRAWRGHVGRPAAPAHRARPGGAHGNGRAPNW